VEHTGQIGKCGEKSPIPIFTDSKGDRTQKSDDDDDKLAD